MNRILPSLAAAFALATALAAIAQTPELADAQPAADAPVVETPAVDAAVPAEPTPPAEPEVAAVEEPAAEVEPAAEPEPAAEAEPVAEPAAEVADPAEMTAPEVAEEASVVVTPAEPTTVLSPVPAPAPAPAPAGPVCCPITVVDYRTTLAAKRAYRCYGPGVETTVCVDNPADCTCTNFAVPLCVPACCVGEPRVCNAGAGLLGRGKVDLVWDCGFTATVIFRVHGGAIVIYAG